MLSQLHRSMNLHFNRLRKTTDARLGSLPEATLNPAKQNRNKKETEISTAYTQWLLAHVCTGLAGCGSPFSSALCILHVHMHLHTLHVKEWMFLCKALYVKWVCGNAQRKASASNPHLSFEWGVFDVIITAFQPKSKETRFKWSHWHFEWREFSSVGLLTKMAQLSGLPLHLTFRVCS